MKQGYFVTGTDTNVGKTWATVALMHALKQQGLTVAAMKPVASGCEWLDGRWQNADALLLQQYASQHHAYELINPYAYELPISPHLAGRENPLELATISECLAQLHARADCVLVEGAGGWYSPLSTQCDNSDLARLLGLPIILVVGMRLGCINHAKLTLQAISASSLPCAGWLAVCNDASMAYVQESIATLQAALAVPLLGVLPHQTAADFTALAQHLQLER